MPRSRAPKALPAPPGPITPVLLGLALALALGAGPADPDDCAADAGQNETTEVTLQADEPEPSSENQAAGSAEERRKRHQEAPAKWKTVEWRQLVKSDPLRFLQLLRLKCAETIVDLTATFHKRERIRGKLPDEPEIIKMKFRADPFSVYMKWRNADKGREVLYVEGQYDNKLQAHPGGLLGPLIQLKIDPHSERAMKNNLRPITAAGMTNMLHRIVLQFELAKANGDLQASYMGTGEVGSRKVYLIKRVLPEKQIYPCGELVVFIDCEALVPVGADSYDWDGQLMSRYRYTDFKINPGLTDEDFDRDNDDYKF